jgi:hypothetical protein
VRLQIGCWRIADNLRGTIVSEDKTTPSRAAGWMKKLGPAPARTRIEARSDRGASASRRASFYARSLSAALLIRDDFAGAGVARLSGLTVTAWIEAEAR